MTLELSTLVPTEIEYLLKKEFKKKKCRWCETSLIDEPIYMYPHGAGWKLPSYKKKMWLFIECAGCGYQWALWKLGVSRDWSPET